MKSSKNFTSFQSDKEFSSFKIFIFQVMGTQMHTLFKSNPTMNVLNAMFDIIELYSSLFLKIM